MTEGLARHVWSWKLIRTLELLSKLVNLSKVNNSNQKLRNIYVALIISVF